MLFFHTLFSNLRPEISELLKACLELQVDLKEHLSSAIREELGSCYEFLLNLPEDWRYELVENMTNKKK